MFATATPARHAGTYRQVGVSTGVAAATPHQLVLMLFDGFDEALMQALGALRDGSIEQKGLAISRASRIVEEGLRANLDTARGGALAAELNDLYGYIGMRLLHAHVHSDAAAIDECRRLVRPLRDAWAAIEDRVTP